MLRVRTTWELLMNVMMREASAQFQQWDNKIFTMTSFIPSSHLAVYHHHHYALVLLPLKTLTESSFNDPFQIPICFASTHVHPWTIVWNPCPPIIIWNPCPSMNNNLTPMPTQNPWAWAMMGMDMGVGTQCRALLVLEYVILNWHKMVSESKSRP